MQFLFPAIRKYNNRPNENKNPIALFHFRNNVEIPTEECNYRLLLDGY